MIKKQKGITLIALIITIVVMLVLVGVTLNAILGEEGLIAKAKEAKVQMQIESDREELISAVLSAFGKYGRVDFTYLDSHLPAGFTGSNGVYTSSNGHKFTVSSDGKVKYEGDSDTEIGPNGSMQETISVYGKYYFSFNDNTSYYEIKNNNTMIIMDEGEEFGPMPVVIDNENQTITVTYEYEDDNEIVTETMIFNYEFIIENDEIINTILNTKFFQNLNGLEFNLDGVYKNAEKTKRYVFNAEEHTVIYETYNESIGDWDYSNKEWPKEYYELNNIVYWGEEEIFTVSDGNYNSFHVDEKGLFTKVNPGEEDDGPEEETIDYTLLGSGDTISGYAPTSYTASNPYAVIASGCTGAFYPENLIWKVTSVSGNTITMKANGATACNLSLTGANGWNNSLTVLNDVCSSVYGGSTSKYTSTARSVAFSDVGVSATPSSSSYTASSYGSNNKFPTSYLTEYQGLTDVTEDVAGEGYATNSDITVTNTSFVISSPNSSIEYVGTPYWVDKRCVVATSSTSASFSVGWVNSSATSTAEATLFDSSGTSTTQSKGVRPVVTLTINDWTCLNTTDGASWTISNE